MEGLWIELTADCRDRSCREKLENFFQEALDRPVQDKPRLRKLLREPGALD